jgi:hypothetical protein
MLEIQCLLAKKYICPGNPKNASSNDQRSTAVVGHANIVVSHMMPSGDEYAVLLRSNEQTSSAIQFLIQSS